MRYTLMVRADRYALVEAVISKLPSHYIAAWATEIEEGTTYHTEFTKGAVEVRLPVGQLATLTPCVILEGKEPIHYVCSGEFADEQLAALKGAMKSTKLVKDVTWWEGSETLLQGVILDG